MSQSSCLTQTFSSLHRFFCSHWTFIQATSGILHVSHLHPHLSYCHDVLDIILDKARGRNNALTKNVLFANEEVSGRNNIWLFSGCTCSSDPGSHLASHLIHTTCQQSEVFAPCLLYKGHHHQKNYTPSVSYKRSSSLPIIAPSLLIGIETYKFCHEKIICSLLYRSPI